MRPDGLDRVQVVDDVDMMRPATAGTRPSTSASDPLKPTRPPPPLPNLPEPRAFPQPAPPPPSSPPVPDEFQDALDPTQNLANLPQSDIVFTGQRPRPELQKKTRRLPAYIERVGDNIQIEGTNYYVSKREGLNLTSKLYNRTGKGRFANRLNFSGITYGDYLDTQRQQANVAQELPPEPPMRVEQPIQEQGNIPIQQEDPYVAEITRLTGIPNLPISRPPSVPPRPPSVPMPRPPSDPKPFPPRPPTPSITPTPSISPD